MWRLVVIVLCLSAAANAWTPLSRGNIGANGGDGASNIHHSVRSHQEEEDQEKESSNWLVKNAIAQNVDLRGGAKKNPVVKGSKNTLQTTREYWGNAWKSTISKISNTVEGLTSSITGIFASKEKKAERALMEQLKTTPVKSVTAPNSTVLPQDVVSMAAKRSNMIGNPLRIETVQEMARNLKQWYTNRGYVLNSVTGATLKPDSAVAELQVEEPTVSKQPVGIIFLKEMVQDDDGSVVTYRQYKRKHAERKSFGHDKIEKADLNITYVQTTGRTDSSRIAKALKLKRGKPFQWDGNRWRNVAGSGIFSRVFKASPERTKDGTVQLQILATEPPPRNLEYGISRSLYTGAWEGEVDFEHNNLLGGGETLGLSISRGTKDPEPSVRLKYSDNHFGMEGGHEAELFSDYIGELEGRDDVDADDQEKHGDTLLNRRGMSISLRNPIDPSVILHSTASANVERTLTREGYQEGIVSGSLGVGPFRKELPMDARSNFIGRITGGTRIADVYEGDNAKESRTIGYKVLPYTIASFTTRQIFPFSASSGSRSITLALSHCITGSTPNIPPHEAAALGVAAGVRGYDPSKTGHVSASLVGSTEVRIPVHIPTKKPIHQDGTVVVFGDWVFAQRNYQSPFDRRSSVGLGLRKTLQGIPCKYDLCFTQDGRIKGNFGLGRDFDV